MTGWGQGGPLARTAGHDINYIAIAGALHGLGAAEGPPVTGEPGRRLRRRWHVSRDRRPGCPARGGAHRARPGGRCCCRRRCGPPAHLEHAFLNVGRWTDRRGANIVDGGAPFYCVYETSDEKYVAVGAIEPRFLAEFLRISGAAVDPADQYVTDRWPAVCATIAQTMRTRTRQEWTTAFAGSDACVSPVLTLREATEDVHLVHRGAYVSAERGMQPGRAPRFSGHPDRSGFAAPPRPGEHTEQIAREFGLDLAQRTDAGPTGAQRAMTHGR